MDYLYRNIEVQLQKYQQIFPVVAILGPRQCGKSTLVRHALSHLPDVLYLDLQNFKDLKKLQDAWLFFRINQDKIICLNEIEFMPDLFPILRSIIDLDRRPNRFILSGSASQTLIQQSSESLAGRIGYLSLTPFQLDELPNIALASFWNRGGFPESCLAANEEYSYIWRENYIRTYIERDIPQLGMQIPALQLRRFITLCAHFQGQIINYSKLAASMEMSHTSMRRYLDLLQQTFLLRILPPFETNTKKRLVKSSKVYIRDSGLLHSLLGIRDTNTLLAHPALEPSWEGMVIEQILSALEDTPAFFYRTAKGEEADLILQVPEGLIVIECKASSAPRLTKGFYTLLEDLKPIQVFVVAPIEGAPYPVDEQITIIGIKDLLQNLKSRILPRV